MSWDPKMLGLENQKDEFGFRSIGNYLKGKDKVFAKDQLGNNRQDSQEEKRTDLRTLATI